MAGVRWQVMVCERCGRDLVRLPSGELVHYGHRGETRAARFVGPQVLDHEPVLAEAF